MTYEYDRSKISAVTVTQEINGDVGLSNHEIRKTAYLLLKNLPGFKNTMDSMPWVDVEGEGLKMRLSVNAYTNNQNRDTKNWEFKGTLTIIPYVESNAVKVKAEMELDVSSKRLRPFPTRHGR
jgi:hypothetical protein